MDDTETLRARIQERHQTVVVNDRAAMEKLLHAQYYYINACGQSYNKEQFLDSFFDQAIGHDSHGPEEIVIEIYGDIANVKYRLEGVFGVGGRMHNGSFDVFHTLAKIDGEWMFLSGHFDATKTSPLKHY